LPVAGHLVVVAVGLAGHGGATHKGLDYELTGWRGATVLSGSSSRLRRGQARAAVGVAALVERQRGWICIYPNFRGRNDNPMACGSLAAQQDILDAVTWAKKHYKINSRRVYLTGVSGGGHMTMLMAGCHPEVWTAASAWVGISDLASWHGKHSQDRYGEMMRSVCGGAPGDSDLIDKQYRLRSPLTHLHRAAKVALDISAGVHDGHTGSVPVRHSLAAFNTIAKAARGKQITEAEIGQISRKEGRLDKPTPSDQVVDPSFGRQIHLRRHAGRARVTIFEGGHEGIEAAAIAWLEKHVGDP
jgi:hypothetical protein